MFCVVGLEVCRMEVTRLQMMNVRPESFRVNSAASRTWVIADEGAAAESTMSVGCRVRAAVCARRVRASSIAASDAPRRRLLPSTLLPPPAPCTPHTPRPLAPRPTAFTTRLPVIHIHSPRYLSTAAVYRQHLVFWQAPQIFTHYYFNKLKVRSKPPAPVYSAVFMYQFGCKVLIRRSLRRRCSIAKGAIKAVYISSRATCKCYFVFIKTELRYKIYVRTL